MCRKLTLALLVTITATTTTFAQDNDDPVARMTNEVIRQFMMPGTTSFDPSVDLAEPTSNQIHFDRNSLPRSATANFERPERHFPKSRSLPIDRPELGPDLWQMPPSFRHYMVLPRPRTSSSLSRNKANASRPLIAPRPSQWAPSQWAQPQADAAPLPRPLALSQASSNGVHAIQAVVPTMEGPKRVNLRGTRVEVEKQLDHLTPEVRAIMARSLGL